MPILFRLQMDSILCIISYYFTGFILFVYIILLSSCFIKFHHLENVVKKLRFVILWTLIKEHNIIFNEYLIVENSYITCKKCKTRIICLCESRIPDI